MTDAALLSPSEMSRLREKREKHKKIKTDPMAPLDELLEKLLERNNDGSIVSQTAQWLAQHDKLSLLCQIKMRTFALSDKTKSFNHKIMLFYVLHEFLKIGAMDSQKQRINTDPIRKARHLEWMATVENVLHACVRESYRDMKPVEDYRKKLLKTLGRWDELGIYKTKLKEWKKIVVGEIKVRKPPQRILQDTVQPNDKEGLDLRRQLDRGNIAWFYEPTEYRSPRAKLRHWRFTGIAFIDTLGRSLGLELHVVMTAMTFYQRLFKRGFYAKERYKIAAASLFLAAKASSQRMRLLRMVHVMHYILETPLVTGDEEKEELERLHLLHYELQVLQGIDFELTIDLPFDSFKACAPDFPDSVRDAAQIVLKDLYWTKMCIEFPVNVLAHAAWYIATTGSRNRGKLDKSMEHDCGVVHDYYSECKDWKSIQRIEFDKRTESDDDLLRYLETQRGGLTLGIIENPKELTNLKPSELEQPNELKSESISRKEEKQNGRERGGRRSRERDENRRDKNRRDDRRSREREEKRYRDDRDEKRYRDDRSRLRTRSRSDERSRNRKRSSSSSRYEDTRKRIKTYSPHVNHSNNHRKHVVDYDSDPSERYDRKEYRKDKK